MRILVDSREQLPFSFVHPTRVQTLKDGDYTVEGMENILVVERKSISDLWACCSSRRAHFRDQLLRMSKYPYRLLVVEGSLLDVAHGRPYKAETPWGTIARRLATWPVEFGIPLWLLGKRTPESLLVLEDMIVAFYDQYTRVKQFPKRWSTLYADPTNLI